MEMALNRIDPAHDWLRQRLEGVSVRAIARAAGVDPRIVLEATSKARRLEAKISRDLQTCGKSAYSNDASARRM